MGTLGGFPYPPAMLRSRRSRLRSTRASEARYRIGLAHRLGMMHAEEHDLLAARYGDLLRAMEKLIAALDQRT